MLKGNKVAHGLSGWIMAIRNGLVRSLLQPAYSSVLLAAVADLSRRQADLLAENAHALLRQQLAILKRQPQRPHLTVSDRLSLLFFSRIAKTWRQALWIVQPDTRLRWHRQGFQRFWRLKSTAGRGRQPISEDTIELIRRMGRENRLGGAERIRGERLKLGSHVAKRPNGRSSTTCSRNGRAVPPARTGRRS